MSGSMRDVLTRLCARRLHEYLELSLAAASLQEMVNEVTAPALAYINAEVGDAGERERLRDVLTHEIVPMVIRAAEAAGLLRFSNQKLTAEELIAGGMKSTLTEAFRLELLQACRGAMRAVLNSGRLGFTFDQILNLVVLAAMHLSAMKTGVPHGSWTAGMRCKL